MTLDDWLDLAAAILLVLGGVLLVALWLGGRGRGGGRREPGERGDERGAQPAETSGARGVHRCG